MAAERYDAFVSYGHDDAEWVHALAGNLERLGLHVFLDAWELVAGDLIAVQLQRGLAAADAVVFVVSAASVGRGWVDEEFAAAIAQTAAGGQRLIPVLAGEVPLPPMVASRLYIDFRHAGDPAVYMAKVGELAAAIRGQPRRVRPVPGGEVVPPPGAVRASGPRAGIRSAYLQQVRRIAPPDPPGLIGREAELAELTRFCVEAGHGPYVWWQAGPWAGKSALLSTFVLRPPPEVRVVSYFITARLAAQDTREAFTQVLLEQLADLTGQELPPVLPEVTREAYLLELLAQAADACHEEDGRLVLVVDGLDEDRGVTTGPDAHSIAGLLPGDPPGGLRVIMAGRPNPPIPDDVPDWHPLRDPGIIRLLDDSPHARDLQRLGKQELQRLLHGTAAEQDLLGLLTAARGGLSGPDLEELTRTPLWEIETILHTVAGRTFARRASQWAPGTGQEVYLLGHEELHTAATRYLGSARLASYHKRLHAWADNYQAQGWPPGTPEYLLRGYFRLLITIGDLPRIIACAGDLERHDRMLDVTGGDVAALAEVRTALDLIAAQDTPDLVCALRLAFHRDQLTDRNASIPVGLPAVWAALGQATRAQALATSISAPHRRALALARAAGALAKAGQHQQATALAADAEASVRAITEPGWLVHALSQVAGALAEAGQHQQATALAADAEATARTSIDSLGRPQALAFAAEALAKTGQHRRAEAIARAVTQPGWQAQALAEVAEALAHSGQHQQAEATARAITSPGLQADALARVAGALAKAGQHRRAEAIARAVTEPDSQAEALAAIAGALAEAGLHQQATALAADAEAIARALTDPDRQRTLARVAGALAKTGQHQRAEATARAITDPDSRTDALARVAETLAQSGQHQHAKTTARAITDPHRQAETLADVARALAEAGLHQQAAALAADTEAAARALTDPGWQSLVLADVAEALAGAGRHEQAEAAARAITSPGLQAYALAQVAIGLARAGQRPQAAALAAEAEATARTLTDPGWQARVLAHVAAALAGAGQHQQAEATARALTDPYWQAQLAGALAGAGLHQQAEAVARAVTDPQWRAQALVWVAGGLARTGQHERAEAAARAITDPDRQVYALAQVARALAEAGLHQQAAALAADAEPAARTITDPYWQALVAGALAGAGLHQQAAALAADVEAAAHLTEDPDWQARHAGALAEAGLHQQAAALAADAEAAARAITDPDRQAQTLALVARALAKAGQHQQAVAAARAITEPDQQANALAELAEALAKAGDTSFASRAAAAACAVGRWTTAAKSILLLNPSVFVPIEPLLASTKMTDTTWPEPPRLVWPDSSPYAPQPDRP